MYEENVERVLRRLRDTDLVLDVGGWACPFNRAQWVLDSEPHETRGFYKTFGGLASQGGDREWFTRDTWVQQDICSRQPWPFTDKQFDFAVCSHTLEDVRDPLSVCSELVRVAKAGYVEVPSRRLETCRGIERPGMVGLSHHRWFVEPLDHELLFIPKYHFIHTHWRYSFPKSFSRSLSASERVSVLWWEDDFRFREHMVHGLAAQEETITSYVQAVRSRPKAVLVGDRVSRLALQRLRNLKSRLDHAIR